MSAVGDDAVVAREAARVLLVDGRGRLLLLQGTDPGATSAGRWWFTPGGGRDPGESAEQAARREVLEETGLTLDELGGPVAERTVEFDYDGVRYRQHEYFFAVRLLRVEVPVSFDAHTELERRAVLQARWWAAPELLATEEAVHPDWLGRWLVDWLGWGVDR